MRNASCRPSWNRALGFLGLLTSVRGFHMVAGSPCAWRSHCLQPDHDRAIAGTYRNIRALPDGIWIFFVTLLCFQTFKKNSAWGDLHCPPLVSYQLYLQPLCRICLAVFLAFVVVFCFRVSDSRRLAPSSFKYAASSCERCFLWVGGECPPLCIVCALSAERVCEASHNTWCAAFGRALSLAHS